MAEELEPDLDEVLDLRFSEISAELWVIGEYSRVVERQLPLAIKNETERLEAKLTGADEYERYELEQRMDHLAEEMLPRFFRGPILVALWAIFESAVIEIGKYLQEDWSHSLGLDDLRGENIFDRAQKYYEHILNFPLVELNE